MHVNATSSDTSPTITGLHVKTRKPIQLQTANAIKAKEKIKLKLLKAPQYESYLYNHFIIPLCFFKKISGYSPQNAGALSLTMQVAYILACYWYWHKRKTLNTIITTNLCL